MKKSIILTSSLCLLFIVFTILVKTVDVATINGVTVGFSTLNKLLLPVKSNTEVTNIVSDIFYYLSYGMLLLTGIIFGMIRLFRTGSFRKVPAHIYGMIFAGLIFAGLYFLFDKVLIINLRPSGDKASYPSTHLTVLIFVSFSLVYFKKTVFGNRRLYFGLGLATGLSIGMALLRIFSLKHWFTDIIGAVILGFALVSIGILFSQLADRYFCVKETKPEK